MTGLAAVSERASVYLLATMTVDRRKFAVLQRAAGNGNEALTMRDSDPQIGDRSLRMVDPKEWPGLTLTVATLTTSPIRSIGSREVVGRWRQWSSGSSFSR